MVNTYRTCEVTVTIPKIGIASRDAEGNEFKCGEIYHINIFAVRPGWSTRLSDFEGLIVGRLDFSGYTESQFSRTQKIIMPNGYELVALRVSESGRPMSWESLPVISSGGYASDSEPFTVKNGEVFIKEAFIGGGLGTENYSISAGIKREKLNGIISRYMAGEATEFTDELVGEVMTLFDQSEERKRIDRCINESIRLHCRPGGLIWNAMSSRRG